MRWVSFLVVVLSLSLTASDSAAADWRYQVRGGYGWSVFDQLDEGGWRASGQVTRRWTEGLALTGSIGLTTAQYPGPSARFFVFPPPEMDPVERSYLVPVAMGLRLGNSRRPFLEVAPALFLGRLNASTRTWEERVTFHRALLGFQVAAWAPLSLSASSSFDIGFSYWHTENAETPDGRPLEGVRQAQFMIGYSGGF